MVVTKPAKARSQDSGALVVDTTRVRASDGALERIEALCLTMTIGDRLPSQSELMRRFGVSERAVREALDTLQHRGRIVRRQGSGTFIADLTKVNSDAASHWAHSAAVRPSIIAVAAADHGFFDRSVGLFCRQAESADLAPVCRPLRSHRYFAEMDAAARHALARSLRETPGAFGFIVFSNCLEPLARLLTEMGGRVVLFGTPRADAGQASIPVVCGDQEYGGYLVTRHLIDIGHRHIAFLQGEVLHDAPQPWRDTPRWRGHHRAIDEARRRGIVIHDSIVSEEVAIWKADAVQAAPFFRAPDAPTALVCWNDLEALQMLSLLARAGVRVPDEVSVTGYDDMPEASRVYPALTTVDPSLSEMIRIAVDLVTRPSPPADDRTVLVPHLVFRDSVAAPRSLRSAAGGVPFAVKSVK